MQHGWTEAKLKARLFVEVGETTVVRVGSQLKMLFVVHTAKKYLTNYWLKILPAREKSQRDQPIRVLILPMLGEKLVESYPSFKFTRARKVRAYRVGWISIARSLGLMTPLSRCFL